MLSWSRFVFFCCRGFGVLSFGRVCCRGLDVLLSRLGRTVIAVLGELNGMMFFFVFLSLTKNFCAEKERINRTVSRGRDVQGLRFVVLPLFQAVWEENHGGEHTRGRLFLSPINWPRWAYG